MRLSNPTLLAAVLLVIAGFSSARGHAHQHHYNRHNSHARAHTHGHAQPPASTVVTPDAAAAAIAQFAGAGQVTAPYITGSSLAVGSGFNAVGLGGVMQIGAIDLSVPTTTTSYQNKVQSTRFLVTSGTDLNSKLSISSQASMSYGAFSANTDVKFEQQIDRSSRSFSYVAEYDIQFGQTLYAQAPTLSAAALALLKSGGVDAFVTAYGQYYVYAVTTGSRLLARQTVTTSSEEMTTDLSVSASASGSFGDFSASVSAQVESDEKIQTFTYSSQEAIVYEGVDLSCMGSAAATSGAGDDPTPAAMDALIAKYVSCVSVVAASGGGIPMQMVLARFDELPDWLSNGFGAIAMNNSILVDSSALADAAMYVNTYTSILTDSLAYMGQGGVSPGVAASLQAMNSDIRAARATIMGGLTLSDTDLEQLLKTVPFWGAFQAQFNRIIGDFRWSSCDWASIANPADQAGASSQVCPSSQTVPVIGGTQCRPSWDTMMMYSYSQPSTDTQPGGWYSQCMNHDNDALSPGQNLYLSCCYQPLLGSCTAVTATNAATLACPSQSQVLIGAGATCSQGFDAMLYQLEPASTYSVNGQCMNHHNDAQSNPLSMSGFCCTLPSDATARFVTTSTSGSTSSVSCNVTEVLVNGGITCPRSADQFILQSYPSTLSSWSGYCINHQNSGLQGPPSSTSVVCLSFAEDTAPPADAAELLDAQHSQSAHLHRPHGYAATAVPKPSSRAGPIRASVHPNSPAVAALGAGSLAASVSVQRPQQLVHYELRPPPRADMKIQYRTTCNVVLGDRGNVIVESDGKCVHDSVYGSITVPRGSHVASIQVLRSGGPRSLGTQSGVVEFIGRIKSDDVLWRRSAYNFTPVRVVISQ